jgi:hypothetical protein
MESRLPLRLGKRKMMDEVMNEGKHDEDEDDEDVVMDFHVNVAGNEDLDLVTTVVDRANVPEEFKDACIKLFQSSANNARWKSYGREGKIGYLDSGLERIKEAGATEFADLAVAFVEAFENKSRVRSKDRLAALDYKIVETQLSHTYDLQQFMKQVEHVARWYDEGKKSQDAPYFCAIQSSGMGKTKLMYHACDKLAKKADWYCCLVLPQAVDIGSPSKSVFKRVIDLQTAFTSYATVAEVVDAVYEKLDHLLDTTIDDAKEDTLYRTVFFCFDEAQCFLETFSQRAGSDSSVRTEFPALLFRIIRLWLRKIRKNVHIVACFAGTTASLSGFRFENDDSLQSSRASREWEPDEGKLYKMGTEFFPVFTQTTTIGCIAKTDEGSEYERAIRYGRPLFAIMEENGALSSKTINVLGRMLLSEKKWDENLSACLSVLATRVQMGQTTFKIASDLVSKGYAILTSVSTGTARVCFMPDPVCARLAMCLMDENFEIGPFKGKDPKWWVDKMAEIFSQGLCSPEKGDVGEVMVAFYLLLSGDILRQSNSADRETFSVSLVDWIDTLQSRGQSAAASSSRQTPTQSSYTQRSKRIAKKQKSVVPPKKASGLAGPDIYNVTISFIQVCRNNLRSYGCDWAGFTDQSFLKYMYESATAFYVFAGCPMIDMAASMKMTHIQTKVKSFAPLFISIKSHYYFGPADAAIECERMRDEALRSDCTRALCLLIVFGSPTDSKDGNWALDSSAVKEMASGCVVARVLRIPVGDAFNVTNAFLKLTSGGAEIGEVIASHPFIRAHAKTPEELAPQYALRASAGKEAKLMLDVLTEQFGETSLPE